MVYVYNPDPRCHNGESYPASRNRRRSSDWKVADSSGVRGSAKWPKNHYFEVFLEPISLIVAKELFFGGLRSP